MESEFYKGFEIEIEQDDFSDSPREWDNLGVMICKHSGYNLGDVEESKEYEKAHGSVESDIVNYFYGKHYPKTLDSHEDCYGELDEKGEEIVQSWIEKNVVMMELFLYDHSGLSMSTWGFGCSWDSGQVGFIYCTKDMIRKNFNIKYVTKKYMEMSKENLSAEVKTYDQYLRGEIYGYTIEYPDGSNDSCSGFYGCDHEENGLMKNAKGDIDWFIEKQRDKHFKDVKIWIRNKVPLSYRRALEL